MKLNEIRELLRAVSLTSHGDPDIQFEKAYCADLMSDVLAFSVTNSLLITGLTNAQVIRTADVANMRAIVFIQSKRPDVETIALADQRKIPLLATDLSMFEVCGILFEKGLRSQPPRQRR